MRKTEPFSPPTRGVGFLRFAATATTAATVAVLAGCASTPPSGPALAVTTASLEAARSSGAPEYLPGELDAARSKLEQARLLAQQGRDREAIRLAEQADVDAQLVRARAGSERSRRAVAELEASLITLREELNRAPVMSPSRAPQ
jgi:hypothetical protein